MRRCVAAALGLALLASGNAFAARWRVVVLPGYDLNQPANQMISRGFQSVLEASAPDGVEIYTEPLDNMRYQGRDLLPEYIALLKRKYEAREVDLVVGVGEFGLDVLARHHADIWPGKPVMIHHVDPETLRRLGGLPAGFAHLPLLFDIEGTLKIVEALQPDARRLVITSGMGPYDLEYAARAAEVARRRQGREWRPEVWSGLPMAELRERLAQLDRNTAVLHTLMYRDRDGRRYMSVDSAQVIADSSNAPVYGWYRNRLARGMVGGSVTDLEENGRLAGGLAVSLLRGRSPVGAIGEAAPPRCAVNVARLEAMGLDAAALPAGCELTNLPPSLWRDYRREVIAGALVLALQAATIAGLLLQRRRRHQAENEAGRRRLELHRAARAASVSELGASIAHEVGQPLGAIAINADVAGRILKRDEPERDEMQAIVADIRRDALRANEVVKRLRNLLQNRPTEFAPLDLSSAFAETLMLVDPEARRRGVAIEQRFEAGDKSVVGDRIQLQQVLLNLVINAMDASRDTAPERRAVTVSLRQHDGGLELEVADRGHGISGEARERLFQSLFTTKPGGMGLGLSIVRTIVAAHGGHVRVVPREGGGSRFVVWLPRRGSTASRASRDAVGQSA